MRQAQGQGIDTIGVHGWNDVLADEWKRRAAAGKIDCSRRNATSPGDRLEKDSSAGGMGLRSKRYCMVVEDGVVKTLNIEDAPGKADISGAENLLKGL